MKTTNLFKVFSIVFLLGVFLVPLAGCGVEDEPVGVDEEVEMEESEEYIEGEQEI